MKHLGLILIIVGGSVTKGCLIALAAHFLYPTKK
jgi:hypothetical protein